jgi:hypothetical protein
VRYIVTQKLRNRLSPAVTEDELQHIYLHVYRELLNGFLGVAAFWDGLAESKKALALFPGDSEILEMRQLLKDGFEDRYLGLKGLGGEGKDLVILSRMGKIFQKAYPWLDPKLNIRPPKLVKEVNKALGVLTDNCEVRPVVFGPPVFGPERHPHMIKKTEKSKDVGPLGIFATRDIRQGEKIIADGCLTGVSQVPSSKMEHCDGCHATLAKPFVHPNEIIRPNCCGKVAYCSGECYSSACNGYHKVLCGKDIDWVYENIGLDGYDASGTRWRPVMFLRLMAIVIADRNAEKESCKRPTHPLQHHVIARMAANYAPGKPHPDNCSDWQFFENVVAPTRILMLLGINIFTETEFSPEVIQTIYWRMENNANMSTFNLNPVKPTNPKPYSVGPTKLPKSETTKRAMPHLSEAELKEYQSDGTVHMICLNPNYLFFNHSCEPNVSWHGSVSDTSVDVEELMDPKGNIHKPGSSTVFCKAGKDIKKGEELKISYIGDPMGKAEVARRKDSKTNKERKGSDSDGDSEDGPLSKEEKQRREVRMSKRKWMEKWFPGGCGCGICERENQERERKKRKEMIKRNNDALERESLENLERELLERISTVL